MTQFDVFLSHNSIDKPWARQLKTVAILDFRFWIFTLRVQVIEELEQGIERSDSI